MNANARPVQPKRTYQRMSRAILFFFFNSQLPDKGSVSRPGPTFLVWVCEICQFVPPWPPAFLPRPLLLPPRRQHGHPLLAARPPPTSRRPRLRRGPPLLRAVRALSPPPPTPSGTASSSPPPLCLGCFILTPKLTLATISSL